MWVLLPGEQGRIHCIRQGLILMPWTRAVAVGVAGNRGAEIQLQMRKYKIAKWLYFGVQGKQNIERLFHLFFKRNCLVEKSYM